MSAKQKQPINKVISPVYVVFGKDRRGIVEAVHQITQHVLQDADPQVALSTYQGDQAQLADVLDDLKTLPFLSPRRLVVVKDADVFITEYRQKLEEYLKSPSLSGVLLLETESFPKSTRLAKAAAKIGQVIACDPPTRRELPAFLTNYALKRHNLKLSHESAMTIIELAGDDTGILAGEIDKIAAYLNGPDSKQDKIMPGDVQKLVGYNRQFNSFNVIDAMTAGNAALALARLDQMLAQDRNAQYTAVGAFAWHFRRLYNARIMLEKGIDHRSIIKQLRIWSQPDMFIRQVRRLNIRQIAAILKDLAKIDLMSKIGAGTVRAGLEKLTVQFCHANNRVA